MCEEETEDFSDSESFESLFKKSPVSVNKVSNAS